MNKEIERARRATHLILDHTEVKASTKPEKNPEILNVGGAAKLVDAADRADDAVMSAKNSIINVAQAAGLGSAIGAAALSAGYSAINHPAETAFAVGVVGSIALSIKAANKLAGFDEAERRIAKKREQHEGRRKIKMKIADGLSEVSPQI